MKKCDSDEYPEQGKGCGEQIQKLQGLAKALHCPTRWDIIAIIGHDSARTSAIREALLEQGYDLSPSGVYYHLRELKEAGLIEVAEYVEEGGGAPEKAWKLTREKIEIPLIPKEK